MMHKKRYNPRFRIYVGSPHPEKKRPKPKG